MKRWTLRIVLLLILGAVTTVAVAWGCIRSADSFLRMDHYASVTDDMREWCVANTPRLIERRVWPVMTGKTERFGWSRTVVFGGQHVGIVIDEDARGFHVASHPNGIEEAITIEEAGWPCHALCGEHWRTEKTDSMRAVLASETSLMQWRYIPLRPIWPEFAIDTLFYAAIWFRLFFGFASARRALRRRRGRCPKCNYDLRGQMAEVGGQMSEISKGCPECGWNRSEPRP